MLLQRDNSACNTEIQFVKSKGKNNWSWRKGNAVSSCHVSGILQWNVPATRHHGSDLLFTPLWGAILSNNMVSTAPIFIWHMLEGVALLLQNLAFFWQGSVWGTGQMCTQAIWGGAIHLEGKRVVCDHREQRRMQNIHVMILNHWLEASAGLHFDSPFQQTVSTFFQSFYHVSL